MEILQDLGRDDLATIVTPASQLAEARGQRMDLVVDVPLGTVMRTVSPIVSNRLSSSTNIPRLPRISMAAS